MRTIEMILNNDSPNKTPACGTRATRPRWPSQRTNRRHPLFRISYGSCISWFPGLSGYGTVLVAALALAAGSPASAVPLFQLKPRVTTAEKARLARQVQEATNAVVQLAGPQPPITLPPATNATDNPLANFWNDPEFLKRFAGSYGFNSELEPKITTTNEMAFYRELALVLRDKPEEAAQRLSTNITAQSSAVLDYTYGTVLFQLGKTEAALKSYENAITKFPGFLRAHKNLGFARVKAGQYAEAVKPLTRTIELGGADANIYGLLAFCYLNQEKYLAAESAYRNAVLLMPDNNDWKLGLIKAQIATGRYVEADRLIEELLAVNPNSDSLLSLQAGLYMQMDRPAKAGFNYEILRRMGKADLKMLMLLGDIYMTQNAKELALGVYLEAIAKDGVKDVSRSLRAADILVRSGAWSEAEQLFKRIRQLHGARLAAEEDLKLLKLESRVAMAAGDSGKAAVALEQIIDKNPLDGEALLLLGDYFARSNEKEKALFRYEMAAKIPEFEPDVLVKQAQLNASQRKFERALELLRKAQKLKPRDNVQRYLEAVERVARSAASTSS